MTDATPQLITTRLMEDMKAAMKARETVKLGVIRFLLAEVKNAEIDAGQLDEAGFQKVVTKLAKQLREGIEGYQQGGRDETAAEETEKLRILETYLPAQLSDDELAAIIAEVKKADPALVGGKLIGAVMANVAGRADGKRVGAAIQAAQAAN